MSTLHPSPDPTLADLTRVLWQQRRLLERLLYHLKVQDLIIGSGDDALLRHAVDDVQASIQAITDVEVTRREVSAVVAGAMGLGDDASLQDLVNGAESPYDEILTEHRDAFLALVADITTTSLHGREHLERGLSLTRQLAGFVLGDAGDGGYDRTGSSVAGTAERRLIDRSL